MKGDYVNYYEDFPYKEFRDEQGNYFQTAAFAQQAAVNAGYSERHVWSVVEEWDNNKFFFIYGPSHHYVNVLGFIYSDTPNKGEYYFEEVIAPNPYKENDHD